METREQTAIRLLNDLASLQNGPPLETYRKDWENTMREVDELLNGIAPDVQSTETSKEENYFPLESKQYSHSPDPVSDTLQEGDWFTGTEEQYRRVLEMETGLGDDLSPQYIEICTDLACIVFTTKHGLAPFPHKKKTKLTPQEFIRRTENTFKTKK